MFLRKRNQDRKPLPVFLYGKPAIAPEKKEEPVDEKPKKTGNRKPKKENVIEPVIDQVNTENNETKNAE